MKYIKSKWAYLGYTPLKREGKWVLIGDIQNDGLVRLFSTIILSRSPKLLISHGGQEKKIYIYINLFQVSSSLGIAKRVKKEELVA
jgi:hypothetical protein